MSRFAPERVKISIGTDKAYRLEEVCVYRTSVIMQPTKSKSVQYARVIFMQPFDTDLSSEPWWMGWRLDRDEYKMPALVHDYMLQHRDLFPEFSRKDIDRVYREALVDQGIGQTECNIRYAGVRLNSWYYEERHY